MSTLQTVLQIYDIWSSAALKEDEKVPRLIKTSSRNNTTDMEYWNTVVNWSMQSCHKEGMYSTGLTMKGCTINLGKDVPESIVHTQDTVTRAYYETGGKGL